MENRSLRFPNRLQQVPPLHFRLKISDKEEDIRYIKISLYLLALLNGKHYSFIISGMFKFLSLNDIKVSSSQFWFSAIENSEFFMATLCSIFFIVSTTFGRFYSIIRPHKAASFNTVKRAMITIASITVFSVFFNIPHFFLSSHRGWQCIPYGNLAAMALPISKIYYWLSFALQFGLPFVLLLVMNSFIIHTLRTRSNLRESAVSEGQGQSRGQSQGHKIKTSKRQVYLILLLVTFAF